MRVNGRGLFIALAMGLLLWFSAGLPVEAEGIAKGEAVKGAASPPSTKTATAPRNLTPPFAPLPPRGKISKQEGLALVGDYKVLRTQYLKYYRARRYKAAEPLMRRALELARYLLGNTHPIVATESNNLGALLVTQRRYRSALPFLRTALQIRKKLLKKNDPKILQTLKDLQTNYLALGRGAKEMQTLRQMKPFYDGTYATNGKQLAYLLDRLGVLQINRQDYKGAQLHLEEALALYEGLLGRDHLDTVMTTSNLAVSFTKQKNYKEAIRLFDMVYKARKKKLGADNDLTLQTLTELSEIASHLRDYKKAIVMGQILVKSFEKKLGRDHIKLAGKHNRLAAYAYHDKDYDLAGRSLARALEITEKHKGRESRDLLVYLYNLATLYEDHGRYTEAEELYARRLLILEKTSGPNAAKTLNAMILLARLNRQITRYTIAEKLFKTALAREHEQAKPSKYRISSIHNNLGGLFREIGRYGESARQYKKAIAVHRSNPKGKNDDLARMYDNTGVLYIEMNLYDEAVDYHKKALTLFEETLGPEHRSVSLALNNLAAAYNRLYRYEEAVKLYERALAIYLKKARPADVFTGVLYDNLAGAYGKVHKDKKAEIYYKKAMDALLLAYGPNHPEVALAMTNLAGVYSNKKQFEAAHELYKKAILINEKAYGPDHPSLANMWRLMGENAADRKDYESARQFYDKALIISASANGAEHPKTGYIQLKLAGLYLWLHDYPEALKYYRKSAHVEELEFARKQGRGEVRQKGGRNSVFAGLAITAWHVSRSEVLRKKVKESEVSLRDEALYAAQRALGTSAGAALAQMSARFAAGSGDLSSAVRQRQDLTRHYDRLDKNLLQLLSAPPKRRNEVAILRERKSLVRVDTQIRQLDKKLAVQFPEYATLANPQPLKTADIQAQLKSDEALLYFMTSNRAVYIWVLTDKDMSWARAPLKRSNLRLQVAKLRKALDPSSAETRGFAPDAVEDLVSPNGRGPITTSFDLSASWQLYKELLQPFEGLVKDKKHLLIVASDALTALPFQVLLTAPPPTKGSDESDLYRRADWLIKRHALTTLPSISSLKALRQFAGKNGRAPKTLIAFGNPVFSRQKPATQVTQSGITSFYRGGRVNLSALAQLSQLPDTKDELLNVARSLNVPVSELKLGRAATEEAVKALDKSGELAQHAIVYFATHGLIAGDIKGLAEPALALSLPAKASGLDDGLLTASEVTQLHLNADWVVLSACNTASGDKPGAEALSGLARAFFYAGAKSLLVSHWPVYSDAATLLTTKSFKIIKDSEARNKPVGRAEALRRAMLSLINKKDDKLASNPSYWAPFVVVGEGAVLK